MADLLVLPKLIAGFKSDDWQDRVDTAYKLAQMGSMAAATNRTEFILAA